MSMNLNCTGVELRQTPTQITYMCMVQSNGEIAWELTGQKAIHAIQIYKEWIRYCRNGIVFTDSEELEELLTYDKEHLAVVDKVIVDSGEKLIVWIT